MHKSTSHCGREEGLDDGSTMEWKEESNGRGTGKKELMVFGKWVEGYFQKAIYILRRNWIICILDVRSMKCRNIQVQMSSGSWKCWLGSQRKNEDCDHVNWGRGGGSLEKDVVSGRGLGEWKAAPRAASWEPTERGKKGSQWKTQRRALRGKTGTREGQEKKVWVSSRRCQGLQWRIEKKRFHKKSEEALQVKSCHECPSPLIFHNITHLCRINFRKADKSEASRIPGPSELWKVLASIRLCLKLSETKNKSMKKFPTLCRRGTVFWNYIDCFPPSIPPPHKSYDSEPSMLFEPIYFWFTEMTFQCYLYTQHLIHHICKLINHTSYPLIQVLGNYTG